MSRKSKKDKDELVQQLTDHLNNLAVSKFLKECKTSIKVDSDDYKFFYYVNNIIIQQLDRILNHKISKQELNDRLETIGVFANLIAMHVQGKDKSMFQFGIGDKDE